MNQLFAPRVDQSVQNFTLPTSFPPLPAAVMLDLEAAHPNSKGGPALHAAESNEALQKFEERTIADSGYVSNRRPEAQKDRDITTYDTLEPAVATEEIPEDEENHDDADCYSDVGSLGSMEDGTTTEFLEWLAASLHREIQPGAVHDCIGDLPRMLREFAIRIGHEGQGSEHRNLMYIAHKSTRRGYVELIPVFSGKYLHVVDITTYTHPGCTGTVRLEIH